MLGAICGDVIGRPYEFEFPTRTKDFDLFRHDSRFSDDTVLTAAVAHRLMHGGSYEQALVDFGMRHIEDGFGKGFKAWLLDSARKQGDSFGNGSAMRVSPVAWFATSLDEAIEMARDSAMPSHSHPEGIKGAVAVAAAVRLSIEGRFGEIRDIVTKLTAGYDLSRSVDEIRRTVPRFKTTCQESVADAIVCALEATSFEDGIRNAVSLGNDADTQASIAGAILEPYFGVPWEIRSKCVKTLSPDIASVLEDFEDRTAHIRRPDGTSMLAGGADA
jgi:ADP-ribosylglycohydrolase